MSISKGKDGRSKGPFTSVEQASASVDFTFDTHSMSRNEYLMRSVQFSKILKKLMADRDISVRQLSKTCGLPVSTLASYLSGKKASYSPEHLERLAEHFDVSIDFLLFGRDRISGVNALPTEQLFEGWLKVKIERAIPISNKKGETED